MFTIDSEGEAIRFQVQVDEIIRQVYAMEEEAFRRVTVIRLRELGYTVIPPREYY